MEKTIFAAIVGRPNTGKSTLLNAILGQKVAIVSAKPQTTRTRITGILTKDETQFVFLDTPGIHKPQDKLGSYMVREANGAIGDVDAVLLVVESGNRVGEVEKTIMKKVGEDTPLILVINKTDVSNATQVAETIMRFSAEREFDAVVPISAKNNEGVEHIIAELGKFANESPWFFPDDIVTDQPERAIAAEIIREKMLRLLAEEIPHGVAVVIESFKESSKIIKIRAEIFCEKDSHKPIIIGKRGDMLKKIGSMAREDMENIFGIQVFLDLWVKVKENWREQNAAIANFGFKDEN
ncbi:MAG: GTPase Era [Clostridia bacterium]|nr:GTPase Era [Clostridia bacterium]MBQ8862970.1 GTPase Era [Clostridia bacterium]